jgi:hypothetical protein
MHAGDRALERFNEGADNRLYHLPWSLNDLIMAATEIYGSAPNRAPEI